MYDELTCTVPIHTPALKAAMTVASHDKNRSILHAVHVEYDNGQVTIDATDSIRLCRITYYHRLGEALINRIVPLDPLKQAVKLAGKSDVRVKTDKPALYVMECDTLINHDDYYDYTYPSFNRLIPNNEDGIPTPKIGFDATYIAEICKAYADLAGKHSSLDMRFGGEHKPAEFIGKFSTPEFEGQFYALLMPTRR